MPRSRTGVRTAAWSLTTTAALAATLCAAPALAGGADRPAAAGRVAPAGPAALPAGATAAPGLRVVTLLTGDRVVLRTDTAGRVTASLTPGSPDYGKQVEFVNTGTRQWLVPRLAPAVRRKLDDSVFDVSALASRHGRVPVTVTFARGTAPRSLPGLSVQRSSARTRAGATVATAWYDARRPLPASFRSSLAGVTRIAVRGVPAQSAAPGYDLHTLTINATTATGRPVGSADVFVLDLDDGRLFSAFGGIEHGQWKVSVPSGHYLVLCSTFSRMLVDQPVVGDTDTSTTMSFAEATVHPRVTLPDRQSLGAGLTLLANDAKRTSMAAFGIFGGTGLPALNPVPPLTLGDLTVEVSNSWTRKGYQPYSFHGHHIVSHPLTTVASAEEVRQGVPRDLSFLYQPADFASVAIRHHATGATTRAVDGWFGLTPHDFGIFFELYPTVRPGVLHAAFAGSRDVWWDTVTSAGPSGFSQVDEHRRYTRGRPAAVDFFRAPVTPVSDRGAQGGHGGFACGLCVAKRFLYGNLSMMSSAGAGPEQFGVDDHGRWALYHRFRRLSGGTTFFSPHAKGVKPGEPLRLVATTTAPTRRWTLSSRVSDEWRFRVPAHDGVVPLLRARYVPPTDLRSRGKPGQVSFPITFDNLGPVDAWIRHARVDWSTNGRWHRAALTRRDKNTFRVTYTDPTATVEHRTLSLRVSATDAAGRTVDERVADAYLLPNARPRHATQAGGSHTRTFRPRTLCRNAGVHRMSCFVRLDARTRVAGRGTPDPAGWGAPALRSAYGLPSDLAGATTTVAVVVSNDYPHAEADLNHYRAQFGLPACTSASGCFTKINQQGQVGHYPAVDQDWGVEAALDLQMVSAACPTCHIVLAEADEPDDASLAAATRAAIARGATVTNHSYGRIETTGVAGQAAPYDQPGVTSVVASGDASYGPASFPASVPDVVAVGGTTLSRSTTDPRGWTERAWAGSGSGCSAYFAKPAYQADTACHMRTFTDVSAVAEGLAVYDTSVPRLFRGWLEVDGTSASSPLVAGMIGAAGAGGIKAAALYGHPGDFNDVVAGRNGFCRGSYICTAVTGYDGPTGWGSPKGLAAFAP